MGERKDRDWERGERGEEKDSEREADRDREREREHSKKNWKRFLLNIIIVV